MPVLRIRLLGAFQIWRGDLLVGNNEWPNQKTKDLCKVLLTERGHAIPQDRLMDLLWPDLAPASAANSLRVSISHLRRLLQPDLVRGPDSIFIHTRDEGYSFQVAPDCWIDVDAFLRGAAQGQAHERKADWGAATTAYQGAVALYLGAYLEENPYDDWAIGPRESLREAHLDLLSRLAECLSRLGHYRQALTACQKALSIDAMRESLYRQMMRYHYRLGQRDQALRAFERCRKVLVEELGVDPMPQTLALYTAILREDVPDEPVAITSIPAPSPAPHPKPWLPLVGRQAEIDLLREHFEAAALGHGRLLIIVGEAGVGKTRLAEELLVWAEARSAWILRGRAYELERELSYQPLREALRGALSGSDRSDRARELLGSWASDIALLLPELRHLLPDGPPPDLVAGEAEQQRLLTSLAQFFLTLAAQAPVMFFLDDLQWADPATVRFIHFLVRQIGGERILVLGTCQADALRPDLPLATIERHLVREGLVTRLIMERLTAPAVAHLLADKAAPGWDSRVFAQRLYRDTEGNPLFIAELLRSLIDRKLLTEDALGRWQPARGVDPTSEAWLLPSTVQAVIEARCLAAGETAQRVLRVAAVIGSDFTFDLLQRAGDLERDRLLDALDILVARQLLQPWVAQGIPGYNFTHDKIREVIYASLSPARRSHLHRCVAVALEELYRGRGEAVAGPLARHYAEAGEMDKATGYLLQAGDQARVLYAHQEAAEHYGRALAHLKRIGAYERAARTAMKLGLSYQIAFDFERARQAFDQGFALWQRVDAGPAEPMVASRHVLRVDWPSGLKTLEPNWAWDSMSTGIVDQLFSGLAEQGPELEVVPDIAHSWEVRDGGHSYIFHLRDDVQWSDGVPVTAEDFEFAWKRVLDPSFGSPVSSLLHDIKGARSFQRGEVGEDAVGVRALDARTLAVELEHPTGYFLHLVSYNVSFPVPRHVVMAHGPTWTDSAHIVTNGPYKLVTWDQDGLIVLVRNSAYHGRFTGNVDRVALRLVADLPAKLALYEAGELDILRLPYAMLAATERVRQRHAGDYISIPMLHTMFLGFDVTRPPFDDVRVRQAFALALDRAALADGVFGGYISPATGGFVPPGMPGHVAGIALPHDPHRARALLAEAGYPDGAGFPAVTGLATRGGQWMPTAAWLQAQWRRHLGIESCWDDTEAGPFIEKLFREPPQLFVTGWYADYPDPDNFLNACPMRRYTGWQEPAYDRLVAEASRIIGQEARLQRYRQAENLLATAAPIVPLTYGREHWLVQPWVKKLSASVIKWWFWKDVLIEPHGTAPSAAGFS